MGTFWSLVALAFGFALFVRGMTPSRRSDVGGDELHGASIFLNEKDIRITRPIKLKGRPDQVWRRRDGKLVPVETKKRSIARAYPSDTVQLTAQRFLIVHAGKAKLCDFAGHGFVRAVGKDGTARFIRVRLLSDEKLIDHYMRARALLAGREEPIASPAIGLCRGCGHFARCAHAMSG